MRIKTFLRYLNAVIVATVCAMIGLSGAFYAYAESADCTLKDVSDWKDRLFDPNEEATPLYRLNVSEDFLHACPNRPEAIEAHRIAGLAALDGGFAEAAKEHLKSGRTPYQHLQPREWLGLVAAMIETGEEDRAWEERDALVAQWLYRLDADGLADVEGKSVRGGTIVSVEFAAFEPGNYIRGVWMAVPNGPGWPSAIILGSNEFRSSMSNLKTGTRKRLEHIDLVGCRERITLSQSEGEIDIATAKGAAIAALTTYLEQPELPQDNGAIDLSTVCRWPQQMFPRPDPYKAVLIESGH